MLKTYRRALNARITASLLRSVGLDAAKLARLQDLGVNEQAGGSEFTLVERQALRLLLDQTSYVDREMILQGDWETAQRERLFGVAADLSRTVTGEKYFLDIGAYWGIYAMMAYKTGLYDRDIAFEPDSINAAQLKTQLMLNHLLGDIAVHEVALSDRSGTAAFFPSHKQIGNRGGAGIVPDGDGRQSVQTRLLDEVIAIKNCFVTIKMDVEDHKLAVVRGARNLLRANRCVLQIECFEKSGKRPELTGLLEKDGYRNVDVIGDDMYFTNAKTA